MPQLLVCLHSPGYRQHPRVVHGHNGSLTCQRLCDSEEQKTLPHSHPTGGCFPHLLLKSLSTLSSFSGHLCVKKKMPLKTFLLWCVKCIERKLFGKCQSILCTKHARQLDFSANFKAEKTCGLYLSHSHGCHLTSRSP